MKDILAGAAALLIIPMHGAFAEGGSVSMDVLGTITGTLDENEREWLTIAGDLKGEAGASANWGHKKFEIPDFAESMGAMAESLGPEERAQLEAMSEVMSQGGGQFIDMMEQITGQSMGAGEQVSIVISGHDPESPNILGEQTLSLKVDLPPAELAPGKALPAEIVYVVESTNSFMPKIAYITGEGAGDATITFDQLELEQGGGHATGNFSGKLCRMDWDRLTEGPDRADCMRAAGVFDTALVEEPGQH